MRLHDPFDPQEREGSFANAFKRTRHVAADRDVDRAGIA
jgi:hypothetical protein